MGIKVRALQRGYYGDRILEEGAVFEIKDRKELSFWIEEIAPAKRAAPARMDFSVVVDAPAPVAPMFDGDEAEDVAPVAPVDDGVDFT